MLLHALLAAVRRRRRARVDRRFALVNLHLRLQHVENLREIRQGDVRRAAVRRRGLLLFDVGAVRSLGQLRCGSRFRASLLARLRTRCGRQNGRSHERLLERLQHGDGDRRLPFEARIELREAPAVDFHDGGELRRPVGERRCELFAAVHGRGMCAVGK